MRSTVVVLLVCAALAGCLTGDAPSDPAPEPAEAAGNGSGNATSLNASGAGPGAHVHDFWGGRTELPLMEDAVAIRAVDVRPNETSAEALQIHECQRGEPVCVGQVTFGLPEPASDDDVRIVPPGTERVEVTVEWSDPTITGVNVSYQTAARQFFRSAGSAESGETVVVAHPEMDRLPLRWTDDGHASVSRWMFRLTAEGGDAPVAVANGTVDVTVQAFRMDGPLPKEPPHPDWYNATSTYDLVQFNESVSNSVQVGPFRTGRTSWTLHPENPVPPGTSFVYATVEVDNESPLQDVAPQEARLLYQIGWAGDWREAETAEAEDGEFVFRVPVSPRMADSTYSCGSSVWRFRLEVSPEDLPVDGPDGEPLDGVSHFQGDVSASLVATERTDAGPSELAPSDAEAVEGCKRVRQFRQGVTP